MIRFTNITGLFLLLYLWYNCSLWSVSINKTYFLSSLVQFIFSFLSTNIFITFIILGVFIYIRSIFFNKGVYLTYFFTLFLYQFLIKISFSMLSLDNITNFYFFDVYHPIPIQWKLYFLQNILFDSIQTMNPELLTNREYLQNFQEFLNFILNSNEMIINEMNALQLTEFSYLIINNFHIYYHTTQINELSQFTGVATILTVFYILARITKNLIWFPKTIVC